MSNDWFPTQELKKIDLMQVWKTGLANPVYRTQFKWDADDCAAVIAKIETALSAHAAYEADKTTAKRIAKDNAMQAAETAMRDFAGPNMRLNKRMPPEYRVQFGVHIPDTEPTESGDPPTLANIVSIKPLGGCAIEIRFQDELTPHTWAIPAAYNGCLLAFAVGPAKVTEYALLNQTDLMTNHIWRLQLPPEAAGQWLSLAIRWQSHTGKKGRWSEILHIAVS